MKWASSRNIRIVIKGKGYNFNERHYGLAADQVLQATVVTTDGRVLVANAAQNQGLLRAIRGGGPGLYGAIVEYVLRTHPYPKNVVWPSISMDLAENATVEVATASWNAMAILVRNLLGLVGLDITGNGFAATSTISTSNNRSSIQKGIGLIITLYGYNTTTSTLKFLLEPTSHRMITCAAIKGVKIEMAELNMAEDYLSLFDVVNPNSSTCSDISLGSSRLLGYSQLTDLPLEDVQRHLYTIVNSQVEGEPSNMIIGLQDGPGPKDVSQDMRGGLNPAWPQDYLPPRLKHRGQAQQTQPQHSGRTHCGGRVDCGAQGSSVVQVGARFWLLHQQSKPFQQELQGLLRASYDRLLEVKQGYDPTNSLYVLSGVGSDKWQYGLNSGMLCAES
ncbi:hypothetical protein ACHAPM_011574 [Fusarium culmorum]